MPDERPEVATNAPWTTEHPHIGGSGGVRRSPLPEPEEERCVGCGRTPSEGVGCSSCPGYNSQGYSDDDDICEGCGRSLTADECECESVDVRRNRS